MLPEKHHLLPDVFESRDGIAAAVGQWFLQEIDAQECMELIKAGGVGRIAFTMPGEAAPTVLPVNFLVRNETIIGVVAAMMIP